MLNYTNFNEIKLQQMKFLKYLMNGFQIYKKFIKLKNELNYKDEDLYFLLLRNHKYTVNDIFLKKPTNKHNERIYLQAKILFD